MSYSPIARTARLLAALLVTPALAAVACSASPTPPEVPSTTAVALEPGALAVLPAETRETPIAPAASEVAPPGSTEPTPARVPNWTCNGTDESRGVTVLRCENAFPPEDRSGKCMCEGYPLDICVDGIRQLMIDRKQCGFVCKPTSQSARKVALRCPDGTNPEASAEGCACSGRKPFHTCAGGVSSAKVVAGECVVTCKQDQ